MLPKSFSDLRTVVRSSQSKFQFEVKVDALAPTELGLAHDGLVVRERVALSKYSRQF